MQGIIETQSILGCARFGVRVARIDLKETSKGNKAQGG